MRFLLPLLLAIAAPAYAQVAWVAEKAAIRYDQMDISACRLSKRPALRIQVNARAGISVNRTAVQINIKF